MTSDRNTPYVEGAQVVLPVKGGKRIFGGAMVAVLAGLAQAVGEDMAGAVVVGRADSHADNRMGVDGGVFVSVRTDKAFCWANSAADPVGAAELFHAVYAEDDETVAKTDGSGSRPVAGTVVKINRAGVWVRPLRG
ncbi:MAG: hypothetical protein FWD77_04545 [Betaproteobacteria bacterium]|nr:hypothetical protein [Betaproteobacteria bacterium]